MPIHDILTEIWAERGTLFQTAWSGNQCTSKIVHAATKDFLRVIHTQTVFLTGGDTIMHYFTGHRCAKTAFNQALSLLQNGYNSLNVEFMSF